MHPLHKLRCRHVLTIRMHLMALLPMTLASVTGSNDTNRGCQMHAMLICRALSRRLQCDMLAFNSRCQAIDSPPVPYHEASSCSTQRRHGHTRTSIGVPNHQAPPHIMVPTHYGAS
jgi:hypothetical protein